MNALLDHARTTLEKYNRLIEQAQDIDHEDLADATRSLVALRDGLLAERRRGSEWNEERQKRLNQINSMLSVSASTEFPVVGVRWERLCMLRDCLQDFVEQ